MPRPTMRTCTSTRTGFHPVSHASLVTKGARRSQEEGPRRASSVGSRAIARSFKRVCLWLGSFGLRVSHVLRVHLNSVARGGRGSRASGAYLSRVSVGETTRSSLRRIELEPSLHPKEEESGSVKSASCVATTAGPTPAAGEDSARRIVLVCRTLKTRYRSRRAATGSEKHPHQSDKRVCTGA